MVQARKCLFSQFGDIDKEADRASKERPEQQGFSDAIAAFWKDVRNNMLERENITIPDWYEKAMLIVQKPVIEGNE